MSSSPPPPSPAPPFDLNKFTSSVGSLATMMARLEHGMGIVSNSMIKMGERGGGPQGGYARAPVGFFNTRQTRSPGVGNISDVSKSIKGLFSAIGKSFTGKGGIGAIFSSLGGVVQSVFKASLGPMFLIASELLSTFLPVITAISSFISSVLSPVFLALSLVVNVVAVPIKIFTSIVNAVIAPFKQWLSGLISSITIFTTMMDRIGGTSKALENTSKQLDGLAESIASDISSAITNPLALFQIAEKIAGLVEKFNPAVVMAFHQVIDDITAIFGRALVPVLQKITVIFRAFADQLVPIIDNALPGFMQVIDDLAAKIMNIHPAIMTLIAEKIEGFGKAIENGMSWVETFNSALEMLGTIGKAIVVAWIEAVGALKGVMLSLALAWEEVKNFFGKNKAGVQQATENRINNERETEAKVQEALFPKAFRDKMAAPIQPKVPPLGGGVSTGLAAAKSAAFVGAADIGRESLKQAFQASSATPSLEQEKRIAQQKIVAFVEVAPGLLKNLAPGQPVAFAGNAQAPPQRPKGGMAPNQPAE